MNAKHIPDASAVVGWRKSTYSGGDNGSCLEVADGYEGGVPVRDSKNPEGPALVVPREAWTAFLGLAKRSAI
ncbi:hypothetical protein SEA_SUCCESS_7 [Streptomyces phage Success]|uniref:DUF397 domain-containing protein n=1 Tax=Streptomyces phage Success TaxID=2999013 RepID=A0A9E8S3R4_9CAUD|nr:hypothetical protein QEH47_gp07 [Streptomyces phage Success]WAB08794.1 hypothetical protein SEA_SUCCESS_7 [Streptomyces phage Success]